MQMHTTADQLPSITSKTSVFGSAVATFYAPSDPSGRHSMRRECIWSTPSWRGHEQQHNCAFVVTDDLTWDDGYECHQGSSIFFI